MARRGASTPSWGVFRRLDNSTRSLWSCDPATFARAVYASVLSRPAPSSPLHSYPLFRRASLDGSALGGEVGGGRGGEG